MRAAALLLLAACGRADFYEAPLDVAGPFTAGDFAVYLNRTAERLLRLDPAGTRPLAWIDLNAAPGEIAVVPGGPALVLARDRAALLFCDAAALTATELELPAVFDRLALAPGGGHAVLSHSSAFRDRAASNVNEIAVVDLGARAVTRIVLETESLGPRAFAFAPASPGGSARLAAAVLDRGIAAFDLLRPDRGALRVNLQPAAAAAQPPAQVVFSADASRAYARSPATDDVFAVTFARDTAGALSASVNFLTGGRGPSDLVTLADPAFKDQVLVVYRTEPAVALLDARGLAAGELVVPLPRPASRAQAVRSGGREVVLLYDSSGSDALHAFDPLSRRLRSARLDAAPDYVAVDGERAAALFGTRRGTAGAVTVAAVQPGADLRLRLQPIALRTPILAAALTGDGRAVILPTDGRALVSLDLTTLALSEVALDGKAQAIAAAGDGWVVDHREAAGRATLVGAAFDRATARVLWGFLLAGEFDPPEER